MRIMGAVARVMREAALYINGVYIKLLLYHIYIPLLYYASSDDCVQVMAIELLTARADTRNITLVLLAIY